MSYKGPKSTTFNGMECLPWGEVFSRCTKGFEEENIEVLMTDSEEGSSHEKLALSFYLSHMSPDLLGLRGKMTPSGLFDVESSATHGHNECRMPNFREAWIHMHTPSVWLKHMPALLAASGPFCFVDASDPRAANFTKATG
jgi:hypothetical protein